MNPTLNPLFTLDRSTGAIKSIPLNDLPEEAWHAMGGENKQNVGTEKYWSAVGILHRCVTIRANAIASLPWVLLEGINVKYNSETGEIPADMPWLSNFNNILHLTEASLVLKSQAFIFPQRTQRRLVGLQWISPLSMTPIWDTQLGVIGYRRMLDTGQLRDISLKDLVRVQYPNPMDEIDPPPSPAGAAILGASVLLNLDIFIEKYFKRGAVKATILTVDKSAVKSERDKLRRWWRRSLSGLSNAWQTEVVSNAVIPVVIGEGVQDLGNSSLTKEKIEAIATTLGVPHSLVFSNAANRATAESDERNFYNHTIVPDSTLVAEALNKDLFSQMGLRIKFKPTQLSVFQIDEQERSFSYANYVRSGMPPSIACVILGIDLPEGVDPSVLDESYKEFMELQALAKQRGRTDTAPNRSQEPATDVTKQFSKWAKKRISSANFDVDQFESDQLTRQEKLALLDGFG